jgi:SAM-dependent methyltransferase
VAERCDDAEVTETPARSAEAGDWDALARLDPFWAICSRRDKRGGGWSLDEFFATGEAEIAAVIARPEARPARLETALDVGCGVGRTARALAGRFGTCYGVDASEEMIELGRRLNQDVANCVLLHDTAWLDRFESESADFVYSAFVLQHLATVADVERGIGELVRVARPDGAVVFQLPEQLPLHRRLQPRRRLYRGLRRLGLGEDWLYRRLRLHPISMIGLERQRVEAIVAAANAEVAQVEEVDRESSLGGLRYYARRA